MKKLFILLFCACFSSWSYADYRITRMIYDQTRVYPVYTQIGRATLIQFEEGESIIGSPATILGMGDAAAWNLSARGNNIVFKPVAFKPNTNLIIVTNKRTYSFDLISVKKWATPTYVLRFDYPDTAAEKSAADMYRAKITASAKAEKIIINTDYLWRGDQPLLKPTAAWDDGRFTRFSYDHAGALPMFFKILPDGTEAQINTSVDPEDAKTIILQEVIHTVMVRLGKDVIEVVNHSYKQPKFNSTGSGMHGAVRVEKGSLK